MKFFKVEHLTFELNSIYTRFVDEYIAFTKVLIEKKSI